MSRNIQYVLTAEFHIDKGPSILHQYPTSLPGYEQGGLPYLAELMLPDQIHKREEDYTLFLLYKNRKTSQFQYVYDAKFCEDSPYFLYTIVNNKNDKTVRRGAIIKSLSIITKLKFFPSFKPLLLIALDSYFDTSNTMVLRQLYESVNVKNLSTNGSTLSMNSVNGSAREGKDILLIKKFLITSILDLPINDSIYHDEYFRNKLLGYEDPVAQTISVSASASTSTSTSTSASASASAPKSSKTISSESDTTNTTPNKDLFIRKDLSFNAIVNFLNFNIPIKIPLSTSLTQLVIT